MAFFLENIAWLPFRLPYRADFATAHGSSAAREGLLLRLQAGSLTGLGEASPVPAFGGGSLRDALGLIERLAPQLAGLSLAAAAALLEPLNDGSPGSAALACALDTALLDLRAQAAGVPLAVLLTTTDHRPPTADHRPPTDQPSRPSSIVRPGSVAVNATVGAPTTEAACAQAHAAVAAGFGCVKLKVGLTHDIAAEVARVAAVRAAIGPGVKLRLDANGAWDEPTALAFIRQASRYDLELIEQPVAAADLAGMARLRAAAIVPLAADEPVGGIEQARSVIAARAANVLVVKPMLAGGLRPARAIIDLALAADLQIIVTTTIDSAVGNTAALHLAATLPPGALACGLVTGALLAADLALDAPQPQAGFMSTPDAPGLGVTLDKAQLTRYGSGWRSG